MPYSQIAVTKHASIPKVIDTVIIYLKVHLKLGIFYRVRLPLAISLFSLFYFRELLIIYLIALICRLVGEKRPLLFISIKAETVTEKIVVNSHSFFKLV